MKRSPRTLPPRPARLFAEPDRPAGAYIANIDGAARGNPGPASYAVIIRRPNGEILDVLKKAIGHSTNNLAEYYALIAALDYAISHRITKLRIRSDSELLVRQMQGRYKVKSALLQPLHERGHKLAQNLTYFSIEHVPREDNREADELANEALESAGTSRGSRLAADRGTAWSGAETRKAKPETRRIRARYAKGALHPAEPLDLNEGAEVEITIHTPPRHN